MSRRALVAIGLSVLAIAAFGTLVYYAWSHRYGGPAADSAAPQPFPTLRVPHLAQTMELDEQAPWASLWEELPPLDVRMMHQVTETPWPKELIAQVQVRAFHDGQSIYCRLEWSDDQADKATAPGRFPDACAVAMPLAGGPPAQSIMMGFSSLVNFWHWRADVDEQIWHGVPPGTPAYTDHLNSFEDKEVLPVTTPEVTTAVADMLAARPGSLTRKDRQAVQGRGVWRDGRWSVVFKRALRSDDPEADVQIQPGLHAAAFAAWNGQHNDRGARKSMSDWVVMDIAPAQPVPAAAELPVDRPGRGAPAAVVAPVRASLLPAFLANVSFGQDERPREITVVAKRFEFNPSTITLRRGELVTLRLESLDVTHGLYLDGYDVQTKARPGMVGKVTFRADKPGRFSYRCSETCGEFHPYMIGYLSVTPNRPFQVFVVVTAAAALVVGSAALLRKRRRNKEAA